MRRGVDWVGVGVGESAGVAGEATVDMALARGAFVYYYVTISICPLCDPGRLIIPLLLGWHLAI